MVAALHSHRLLQRDNGEAVALGALFMDPADVVAAIHRHRVDKQPATTGYVDQRRGEQRLGLIRGFDVPRDGQPRLRAGGEMQLEAVEAAAFALSLIHI